MSTCDGCEWVVGVSFRGGKKTYNLSGTLDGLALLDESVGTEKHDTDLAGFEIHAHALDAGGELDELLGLDVGHTVNTGDTVTVWDVLAPPFLVTSVRFNVPDGKNTSGLGKVGLILDTADAGLEDRGDLGGRGLGVSSIATDAVGNGGGDASLYRASSQSLLFV